MNAVVLITGATRGIGFAAAEQLAARGALVIVASRDTSRAQAAAEKIGRNTSWLSLDINDPDSVNAAATSIAERHGRLDVLANNSAVLLDHYEGLDQLKPETLADTLKTNIVGTLRISQAMKDLLHKSPAPRIINVSSRAGHHGKFDVPRLVSHRNGRRQRPAQRRRGCRDLDLARTRCSAFAERKFHQGSPTDSLVKLSCRSG